MIKLSTATLLSAAVLLSPDAATESVAPVDQSSGKPIADRPRPIQDKIEDMLSSPDRDIHGLSEQDILGLSNREIESRWARWALVVGRTRLEPREKDVVYDTFFDLLANRMNLTTKAVTQAVGADNADADRMFSERLDKGGDELEVLLNELRESAQVRLAALKLCNTREITVPGGRQLRDIVKGVLLAHGLRESKKSALLTAVQGFTNSNAPVITGDKAQDDAARKFING